MKKACLLIGLGLIMLFSSAFSFKGWQSSLYDQIKAETIKGLEANFKTKVKIGKASGLIVGQIAFSDVEIPGVALAKKVTIYFDPLVFAMKKDVVPAISTITIEDAEFAVKRSKDDQLNVVGLLPPEDPNAPPPPPFRAKLIFKNCVVNYQDSLGFRSGFKGFQEKIHGLNGSVSFQRKDRIDIKLSGQTDINGLISISGKNNYKTGKFNFDITGKNFLVGKWGNYAVPLDLIDFKGGQVDLALKLASPKTPGWPISLAATFKLRDASAVIDDYKIDQTSGILSMVDDSLAFSQTSLKVNKIPLEIKGRLYDFAKLKFDLSAKLVNAEIKNIVKLFPQTTDFDLSGLANAQLTITGPWQNPRAFGQASIAQGKLYNQAFSGAAKVSFENKLLQIDISQANIYQGQLAGNCTIDFSKPVPFLICNTRLQKLDLSAVAQNAPGVVGQASGGFSITGPLTNLKGELSADLKQAMLFGQPIANLNAAFVVEGGNMDLLYLSATSPTASIHSSGKIKKDLSFNFKTRAQGIKLSGQGLIGKMQANLDFFEGSIDFKLNDRFLASPLKNLTASGQVQLSEGTLGEQAFDMAQGKIRMGEGLLVVENAIIAQNQSVINASGQTGIGYPTNLSLSGTKINLEDLKIVNYLLPEAAKNPTGTADLMLVIFGEIPKDTQLTSLDPILDLSATGEVRVTNTLAADVPIKLAQVKFNYDQHRVNIPQADLETERSNLRFSIKYGDANHFQSSFSGILDFSEFKKFTNKYGKLDGKLGINLVAEGDLADPDLSASFWLRDFNFNTLNFDEIDGSLLYSQNVLTLPSPARVTRDLSRYEIAGTVDFQPLKLNKPEDIFLNLSVKAIQADLSSAIDLSEKIRAEFARKFFTPNASGKVLIDPNAVQLPHIAAFEKNGKLIVYADNGVKDFFLNDWKTAAIETKAAATESPGTIMGGALSGNIVIQGKVTDLAGEFNGEVKEGFFRDYQFDNLKAKASLKAGEIKIDQLELNKKRGNLTAKGKIGFDNTISLDLTANNLPLDILRTIFKKDFDGVFNMNASIEGDAQNPTIAASLVGKDVELAGVHFDTAIVAFGKTEEKIYLHNIELIEDNTSSKVSGFLRLPPNSEVSLEADLKDNGVGLFNLLSDEIRWKEGQASATGQLTGTFNQLDINGKIFVKQGIIYVKAIDADISQINGQGTITQSQLVIPALTGIWQGKTSKQYPNFIGLAGNIDLSRILAEDSAVELDLAFSPTSYLVDLPNLFSGVVRVDQPSLSGPFHFNFSQGPTIRATAEVDNALITLARKKGGPGKPFPLNLDLTVALDKNVYATMGDVTTFDLSNIFMNLEAQSDDLKISGSLGAPSLLGKITLKRGTVNIFNREFVLLNPEQQKKYYPLQSDKVTENIALFTGEQGTDGVKPEVTITAKVDVENVEEDASGDPVKKRVIILSHLQGVIGAKDKERGLNIDFASFEEDKSEVKPADYSEQEIKVMLLPDFIKSLTGIDKDEDVDTNAVLADYLSSRLQTYVFRGLERELEQRLGLESLTLEYNFGKDVRQAMGVAERRSIEGDRPDWRVGFVKGLFDRLYLDVNYSQYGTDTDSPAAEVFDYQLTYKLSPIWSIIYYREPASFQELTSGYQQITLKAGFSFW